MDEPTLGVRRPVSGESDDDIARRIRGRDARAFDAFFARFGGPLLHYLCGMTRDRMLAEDLVQETVLRVHRHIGRYEERGTFRAWVFRIATNLALTELRRRPRAPAAMDDTALERADPDAPIAEAVLESRQRASMLDAGLAELPPEHRAVLLLRVREEMDLAAIAGTLGIPVGTVKSRIHHAVKRLRAYAERRDDSPERGDHR